METEIINLEGWTLRVKLPPERTGFPVLLMLHGWLGNEDVMWIFASRVPKGFGIFAPRALHAGGDEGYGWTRTRSADFSSFADLEPSARALGNLVEALERRYEGEFSKIHVMGFSQGAALAYTWAARSPGRVRSLAALAGFIPEGTAERIEDGAWAGLPVFIAHGTRDETVPIERMRAGAEEIEFAGADVTICEDDVGHKLSADCLRALGGFYERFV